MARSYPRATVVGCEVDQEKLEFCKSLARELRLRNAGFRYGDLTDLAWGDENFDLIVNIDVLEHLSDHKLALRTFHQLLKAGGYLYVHVPQPDQKRIFGRLKRWDHTDHKREGFKAAELSAELTQIGFQVVDVKPTFGYLGKLAWELNHITLGWSLWLAAMAFPLLNVVAKLDARFRVKEGLGVAIIAQRES